MVLLADNFNFIKTNGTGLIDQIDDDNQFGQVHFLNDFLP